VEKERKQTNRPLWGVVKGREREMGGFGVSEIFPPETQKTEKQGRN